MHYQVYKLHQQGSRQLLSIVDSEAKTVTLAVWCEHTESTLLYAQRPEYADFCRAMSMLNTELGQ